MKFKILLILVLLCSLMGCMEEDIVLNNNILEVRLSKHGGSISHVSLIGGENLINDYDKGRQIQQSVYAGEDQTHSDQHSTWSPWPWNPVQSGDAYGNSSGASYLTKTGSTAGVVTSPLLWDRHDVPAQVLLFNTVSLEDNKIHVKVYISISQNSKIVNPIPRHQEMPAVYTIPSLNNIMTYVGDAPYTNDRLTQVVKIKEDFIWDYWPSVEYPGNETERWAGAFDDSGFGVGVYMNKAELFIGGTYVPENAEAAHTTYFAPLQTITLKPGDSLFYEYWIIVGHVADVREFAYQQRNKL